jgi:hypothetical protein
MWIERANEKLSEYKITKDFIRILVRLDSIIILDIHHGRTIRLRIIDY